jgi:DNA-binding SARP family transcriptional activator
VTALELRLLGGADLRWAGGADLPEVVRQPKRLALLAYLAVEREPRFHRRDSLLALFWPEMDGLHARASLRRTLHFLRAHLGDAVLETRGDEVAVAAYGLWCDVPAFIAQVEEGRLEAALDLYRGDLLEGFFVPTASGFERWLDEERDHLRRTAAGAAWQLAEAREAAGDVAAADRWGRRAITLAPDDEVGLRRLLALFDRLGDRAAAAQVYEDFARRLKQEMDLEPSPETRALMEGIRLRTKPVAASAASAAPAAPAAPAIVPNRIAVLPFAIRGGPELAYLREGLVDLLSVKLDGAGDLGTVDPHALLGPAGALDTDETGPDAARAIAARFGAGQFILGSVVSAGPRLLVRITLYQTGGTDEVRVDGEADGEAGLSALVDDVVRRLLAGRTTSLGGHLGRLGATMTASLAALKAYLAGERGFRQGRYVEAAAAYERALSDDAGFALARYRLAAARAAAGRLDDARREAADAARGRHLAVHVRLLLAAQVAWLDGDLATAERRYLAVLDERPEDVDAWFGLARLLFDGNPLRGRSAQDARAASTRTVALDPRHVGAIAQLARLAALERRADEVDALVERFLSLSPEGDDAAALLAVRAGARGDAAAYDALFDRLAAARPAALARSALDLALTAADPAAVAPALERLGRLTAAAALGAFPALVAAHVAAARGAYDEAARALDRAARLDADASLAHRAWLAAAAPAPDALDQARILERLDAWTPAAPAADAEPRSLAAAGEPWPLIRAYLRGLLAAALGQPEQAEARAVECEALGGSDGPHLAEALARGVRARAALARGAADRALDILEGIRLGPWTHRAAWSPFPALGLERLARGQALVTLGRTDEGTAWLAALGERSVFELACRSRARELIPPRR